MSDLERFRVVDAEPCDERDDCARRGGFVWGVLVGVVIGAWAIAIVALGHLVLR